MFVALVIQHLKAMHRVLLSSVTCPALQYFSALSPKRFDFRKNITQYKMCLFIFSTPLSEICLFLRRIQRDIVINKHRSSSKMCLFLSDFDKSWNIYDRFLKNPQILNFIQIRLVRVDLFNADRRTDGHCRHANLITSFHNSAKAPRIVS